MPGASISRVRPPYGVFVNHGPESESSRRIVSIMALKCLALMHKSFAEVRGDSRKREEFRPMLRARLPVVSANRWPAVPSCRQG